MKNAPTEETLDDYRETLTAQRRSINRRKGEVGCLEAMDYARNAVFFEDKLIELRTLNPSPSHSTAPSDRVLALSTETE